MFSSKSINSNKNSGFSLIELVVSIAVLSILSAIAIPSFFCFQNKSKATAAIYLMQEIQKIQDMYIEALCADTKFTKKKLKSNLWLNKCLKFLMSK